MNTSEYHNDNTVLYLSGMFAGGWIWDDTIPALKNVSQVVVDDPLCAVSDSLDGIVCEVYSTVRGFDKPVTLVGNSLGGYIALKVASLAPDCVKRVVISGSAGFDTVNLNKKVTRTTARKVAGEFLEQIYFDPSKITPEISKKVADCFEQNWLQILRLMVESNDLANVQKLLKTVKCEVKAIYGKDDKITPLASVEQVFERFNVEIEVIDNCGHSPMVEAPEMFSDALSRAVA